MRITQIDGLTHTVFMLLSEGQTFPEDNYLLALEWYREGLLDREQSEIIKLIFKTRGEKLTMADLNRIEVDRIVNLVVGFGWEKIKEELTDTDILLVLKKKRVALPDELGAGPG